MKDQISKSFDFSTRHIALLAIYCHECDQLMVIASQVHACNILRALYRETKLGEDVFPFVSNGVVVAVKGFHSNNWAVSLFQYLRSL